MSLIYSDDVGEDDVNELPITLQKYHFLMPTWNQLEGFLTPFNKN